MPKKIRRAKKSPPNYKKPLKYFPYIAYFIIFVFSIINISLFLTYLGNQLLVGDQYMKAGNFYSIASLLNPWNAEAKKGKVIAKVIEEERKRELQKTPAVSVREMKSEKNSWQYQIISPSRTILIPVLMYHYIRMNPYPDDKVGFNLSVTPYDFDIQMKYLVNHGYHTINLDELGAALLQGSELPDKPIVISIDDGYRDTYTAAYPILKKYNLQAINFIVTSFVDTPKYLTWEMIHEMKESNVLTFGAHTEHHIAMTYISDATDLQELQNSKHILETKLGYPVNWFAYPYGNMDARVAGLVAQSGYIGAFGTQDGMYQSTNYMFSLPRIRIGGGMSLEGFASRLPWK